MSSWLAPTIIVVSAGAIEGARRAWKHRRPFSIEQIGTSLATARAKQSQLPEIPPGADRAARPPATVSTPTPKQPGGPRTGAEHPEQARQDADGIAENGEPYGGGRRG